MNDEDKKFLDEVNAKSAATKQSEENWEAACEREENGGAPTTEAEEYLAYAAIWVVADVRKCLDRLVILVEKLDTERAEALELAQKWQHEYFLLRKPNETAETRTAPLREYLMRSK